MIERGGGTRRGKYRGRCEEEVIVEQFDVRAIGRGGGDGVVGGSSCSWSRGRKDAMHEGATGHTFWRQQRGGGVLSPGRMCRYPGCTSCTQMTIEYCRWLPSNSSGSHFKFAVVCQAVSRLRNVRCGIP